ncbi:Cna B-type domain-containing protein, partial [uncultured Methanobrevibacter sp.]|uniref:Cna B-type domain-containing protein n=1 Tax=uncultured Methanobrevibacter sp. TaxID=253161 RepID=UPI0025F72FE4
MGVIEFPVKIVWEDNDNDARKRPSSVIVIVNAGADTRELELTDVNDWRGSAENIPDADKDSISVQDVKVDGYTTKITGNSTDGYEITCTYKGDSKDNSTDPSDDNKKKDSTDDKDSKKETTIIKKTTTTTTKEVPVKKEAKEVKNESKKDPNKEKLKHDTGNPILLG